MCPFAIVQLLDHPTDALPDALAIRRVAAEARPEAPHLYVAGGGLSAERSVHMGLPPLIAEHAHGLGVGPLAVIVATAAGHLASSEDAGQIVAPLVGQRLGQARNHLLVQVVLRVATAHQTKVQ
jgi:hypothetical protein